MKTNADRITLASLSTPLNQDTLAGKTYLVTGAATGYGLAISSALAEAGAKIIMLDKNLPELEKAYDEVDAYSGTPILYPLNLEGAEHADYLKLAELIKTEFGNLDGIVHNASAAGALTPLEHHNIKAWFTTLQINLNVPFIINQCCHQLFAEKSDSRVIYILDTESREHNAYWGAYGVTKSALESLMLTQADETDNVEGFVVAGVDPDVMNTAARRKLFPGLDPQTLPTTEERAYLVLEALIAPKSEIHGKVLKPK